MDHNFPQKRKNDEDEPEKEKNEKTNSPQKELKSNKTTTSLSQNIFPNKDKKKSNKQKHTQPTLEFFGVKSNIEDTTKITYPKFPTNDKNKTIKIVHWNINGLRPLLKTKELDNLIKDEDPDFICFNETKIDFGVIEKMNYRNLFNKKYKSYWNCPTEKKGYSGTAIFSKYEPISFSEGINIEKHDQEGRVLTLEFENFFLISCYTPNSGANLKRIDYRIKEWDEDFFNFIKNLSDKKDIILAGDLNVIRDEIDISEAKGNERTAGFTKIERESFTKFLSMGFCDTFRELHPGEKKFSFYVLKAGKIKDYNNGCRVDYFIVNDNAKNIVVKESNMLEPKKYNSSDHIPIFLTFNCK